MFNSRYKHGDKTLGLRTFIHVVHAYFIVSGFILINIRILLRLMKPLNIIQSGIC